MTDRTTQVHSPLYWGKKDVKLKSRAMSKLTFK